MRLKLASAVDLSDTGAVLRAVEATARDHDLTLSSLAGEAHAPTSPRGRSTRPGSSARRSCSRSSRTSSGAMPKARPARPRRDGHGQFHRLHLGVGLDLSLPPLSLPVDLHLFQDSPSVAMGIFEGHMAKMAEGFKAVRMAEKELAGDYIAERDEDFFRRFNWQQFSDEEWLLCPPVVSWAATAPCTTSASRTCRAR
jgi:pyruvate-ferredoxin/flavodoxin oxidoreductase